MPADTMLKMRGLGLAVLHRQRMSKLVDANILREYQGHAVSAAVGAWGGRGIIQVPTGGGKTHVAAGIISCIGGRWLYVVQNKELAAQTEASFLKVIPTMCAHLYSDDEVTMSLPSVRCCSYGDVTRLVGDVPLKGIIVDECVPAGTLIGSRPIERIRPGDLVPSWDPETGDKVLRSVLRIIKQKPRADRLIKLYVGNCTIVATPEHPIATTDGWKPIQSIRCGDTVLSYAQTQGVAYDQAKNDQQELRPLPNPNREEASSCGCATVLQQMQKSSTGGEAEESGQPLQGMREACRATRAIGIGASQTECSLLLREAQASLAEAQTSRSRSASRIGACRSDIQADDGVQSYEKPRDAGASSAQNAGPWLAAESSKRWKRAAFTSATTSSGGSAGLENRSGSKDRQAASEGHTNSLQNRHRRICTQAGNRDRWKQPQQQNRQDARYEKGGSPCWTRVDRIEIQEQTSDGTFGGLCPDGLVYNLKVEGSTYDEKNYIANGFVAHNCHGAAARTRADALVCTQAEWHIGLSATALDRQDKKNGMVVALLGPIIYEIDSKTLESAGALSPGKVIRLEFDHNTQKPRNNG